MKNIFIVILLLLISSCSSTIRVIQDYHQDKNNYIIVEKNDIPRVVYISENGVSAFISPDESYLAINDRSLSNASDIIIISLDSLEKIDFNYDQSEIPEYSDHIYFKFIQWVSENEFTYSLLAYNGLGGSLRKNYLYKIKK
jgi:hypothetical protein